MRSREIIAVISSGASSSPLRLSAARGGPETLLEALEEGRGSWWSPREEDVRRGRGGTIDAVVLAVDVMAGFADAVMRTESW